MILGPALRKRIADRQSPEHAAVLHVVGQQRVAPSLQCSGEDERVVNVETMVSGQGDRGFVSRNKNASDGTDEPPEIA